MINDNANNVHNENNVNNTDSNDNNDNSNQGLREARSAMVVRHRVAEAPLRAAARDLADAGAPHELEAEQHLRGALFSSFFGSEDRRTPYLRSLEPKIESKLAVGPDLDRVHPRLHHIHRDGTVD